MSQLFLRGRMKHSSRLPAKGPEPERREGVGWGSGSIGTRAACSSADSWACRWRESPQARACCPGLTLSWPDGGRNPTAVNVPTSCGRPWGIIPEAYLTSSCHRTLGIHTDLALTIWRCFEEVTSFFSPEFPPCGQASQLCNVLLSVSFFSPEREFSYILAGQPHPEGWGEDERRRGGDRRKARWECSILGNMRRAEREQAEPRRTSSLFIVQEHKSMAGWRPPSGLEYIREQPGREENGNVDMDEGESWRYSRCC